MSRVVAWNDGRPSLNGHWIHVGLSDDAYDATPSAISAIAQPGIVGVSIRNYWRAYEPTQGNYDFSTLENVVNYIVQQNLGLKVICFLQDRSFNASQPCPQYIVDQGNSLYYTKQNPNSAVTQGWCSARWKPEVMDRIIGAKNAMLSNFGDAIVVGENQQETSLGLSLATRNANGYTPEAYRDQLIRQATEVAQANPTRRICGFYNFLAQNMSYLDQIMATVSAQPYGVALGGPDILPGDGSLDGADRIYDKLALLALAAYIFNSGQYNSYDHPKPGGGFYSPEELRDFAVDRFNASFIHWNLVNSPRVAGGYSTSDVYAMAAAHPDVHHLGYVSHTGTWSEGQTITMAFDGRRGLSGTPTAALTGSLGSTPLAITKQSLTSATVALPGSFAGLGQDDERLRIVVTNTDSDVVDVYRPISEGGTPTPYVPPKTPTGMYGAAA